VTLLPRGQAQALHYRKPQFEGITVVGSAMDILDIAPDCDLFIGAGGTMTREMAVLGIPTISVYQDALLNVDRYLLEAGAFIHRPQLTADDALGYLQTMGRQSPNADLLARGHQAYALIKNKIVTG
jgi:predicted glycosyltransferase